MTALGQDVDATFTLEPSSIVVMEKFVVKDQLLALDAGATGAASLLDRERLLFQPTAQRSFADLARTNTMVTLRNVFGDRQEGMLAAVGTNNRFNSVMLDGARIKISSASMPPASSRFFNRSRLKRSNNFDLGFLDVRQSGFTGAPSTPSPAAARTVHGSVY